MDLPPSALLGRLQAFLPEMEKANRTTERLFADGKLDVIDANLAVATDQQHEDEGGEATDNEDEAEEEVEDGIQGGRNWPDGAREEGASGDCRTVQLDFALGDFDNNPIAKMEEEKEEEDNLESGENGLAGLLGVSEKKSTLPGKEKGKPLIEEL